MTTMNVSLPEELKSFVDAEVEAGNYGSTSEYVRELIRRDQDRRQLRAALLEGARSPITAVANAAYFASLRDHAKAEAEHAAIRVDLRAVAAPDIDSEVTYYRNEAGPEVAVDFVDQLKATIGHLLQHPLTGSLRFSYELEIPGLRSWPVQKFPYLVFYVADDECIDIWRVLHARRDPQE